MAKMAVFICVEGDKYDKTKIVLSSSQGSESKMAVNFGQKSVHDTKSETTILHQGRI